jgi:hypothetical protein
MKKQVPPKLTQAHVNKLVLQLLRGYKKYHAELSEYDEDVNEYEVDGPVYLANTELERVLVPCLIHLEEVESFIATNDEKWEGKLKALGEAYIGKMIDYVADENAKVFAHLFIHNGSNVGDVDDLGDDHEDDE